MATIPANQYCCVAASPAGFLRQLTANILPYGYRYYSAGCIREPLKPESVDENIIQNYRLNTLSKDQRFYYRSKEISMVHYLRYGRFYLLLACEGSKRMDKASQPKYNGDKGCQFFFENEKKKMKDIRESPIHFKCYLISRNNYNYVRLDGPTYKELAAKCLQHAPHWKRSLLKEFLKQQFARFEAYAGVRAQFSEIVHRVNKIRKKAGLELVSGKPYLKKPRVVKVWYLQEPCLQAKAQKSS